MQVNSMQVYAATVISEQAKELLRTLLCPTPLQKGDGPYEIGVEANKRAIVQSLESFLGGPL
jgi:hypothetical protein